MKRRSERDTVRLLLALTEEAHDLLGQEQALAGERRKMLAELADKHADIRAERQGVARARRSVILSLLDHHGWTQVRVAELLEVSVPRVNYIVHGRAGKKRTLQLKTSGASWKT